MPKNSTLKGNLDTFLRLHTRRKHFYRKVILDAHLRIIAGEKPYMYKIKYARKYLFTNSI